METPRDEYHWTFRDNNGAVVIDVKAHTGKETGWRFARCQNQSCDWNLHGPDRDEIDADANEHFEQHLKSLGHAG
ncbi:Uncharacterised protein [Mycobacteroides abscessus subsp. massiliense]|nr:Uncharacterised protein [Mycobacteroides abscessus subsp. massiliense]